ncbi:hypothetical protein [Candidatus Paracaedibacter symbiosus]|uniref:F0F1 ATP synthase subunit B family protein n=1 Tax=Candidatus Paracaedibacter symbiosus TaxID=244582 RepID=UPI000509EACB|nr:hypothetical protein [Candidatus Paracaedibacter symbiosus]
MFDASFILFICFIGFTGIAFKFGYKKSLKMLDDQIITVSKTVENALNSLKAAQEKHAYEKKYGALIEQEVQEIFKRTQHQIEEIQHQAEIEFNKMMQNRAINADSQIDRVRTEVMHELTQHVTDQVAKTLESLFSTHLSQQTQITINDHFLSKLDQLFHSKTALNDDEMAQKKISNLG